MPEIEKALAAKQNSPSVPSCSLAVRLATAPQAKLVRKHFRGQAVAWDAGSPFTAAAVPRACRDPRPGYADRTGASNGPATRPPGRAFAEALRRPACVVLQGRTRFWPPPIRQLRPIRKRLAVSCPPRSLARRPSGSLLASAPQTNEIARSGMLLPGFLLIARETGLPLALHEIGSSAGLNLLFDRSHYRYGDAECGDPASAGAAAAGGARRGPSDGWCAPSWRGRAATSRRSTSGSRPAEAELLCLGRPDGPAAAARRRDRSCRDRAVCTRKTDAADFVREFLAARSPGSPSCCSIRSCGNICRATKDAILAALQEAGAQATAMRRSPG